MTEHAHDEAEEQIPEAPETKPGVGEAEGEPAGGDAEAAPVPPRKAIEVWADELKTPKWLFAAMKVGHRFPVGWELTEAEYHAALKESAGVTCR